ncbi:MAG: response regulator [Pseudomonadota bacterium]
MTVTDQNQCIFQMSESAAAPTVLLAGFTSDDANSISHALGNIGWISIHLTNASEIERASLSNRFDVIVVDAEKLEVYAPHFIARLRNTPGPSSSTTILAVTFFFLEGFQAQLVQSGADLVIAKPSDPKLYVVNVTRAATQRLQAVGPKNA